MFTTGTEWTTAITDLINAFAILVPVIWLIRQKPLTKRNKLWATAFAMLMVTSLVGFLLHGIVMSNLVNGILWCGFYLFLTFMVCTYVIAIKHDIYPDKDFSHSIKVNLIVAVLVSILLGIARFTIRKYAFVFFSVYAMANLINCVILLRRQVRERPAFKWYIAAIAVLFVGSVLQSIKTIHFTLIWEFNYNAVYHWVMLLFVLIQFKGVLLVGKEFERT